MVAWKPITRALLTATLIPALAPSPAVHAQPVPPVQATPAPPQQGGDATAPGPTTPGPTTPDPMTPDTTTPDPTTPPSSNQGGDGEPAPGDPDEAAPPGPTEPSSTIAADPAVLDTARAHFQQGVAFAEAGNCDGAIGEFLAAYRLIPRANALYNVAQCQERLFRYDLAIRYYQQYLDEAEAGAPDRSAVEAALRTLGNLLATLHVQANVRAEVWVDDRLAGEAPGDVLVPAGGHSVELRADGYIPARTEVRVVGREEVELSLSLVKARTTVKVTQTTGLSPALFWVGVTATAVSLAVGAGVAVHVGQLHSEGTELPARHPERERIQDDAESAQLTADIFFGAAAVLGVATTVVAFMTKWDDDDVVTPMDAKVAGAKRPGRGPGMRVFPVAGAGEAGLLLRGHL